MFSLDKLKVYDRALSSAASLVQLAAGWEKRHAVVDHLVRASESVVLNLAEGARLRGTLNRQHVLDYAIGSALECAACLDIAFRKEFLRPALVLSNKESLCEVVRMLVGLRKSWAADQLHESAPSYGGQEKPLFGHERLEAYQVGLDFMGWLDGLPGGAQLSSRSLRQIDKSGTGRCLDADRRKFLETAESATVKAAAYLDLSHCAGEMDSSQRRQGIVLLDRVALLVRGLGERIDKSLTGMAESGMDKV
jgi:four helix bundle protein